MQYIKYLLVVLLLNLSCSKSNDGFKFPAPFVEFSFDLSHPKWGFYLQIPNNSYLFEADEVGKFDLGYFNNGVIVYNGSDGYYAFDATCPHHTSEGRNAQLVLGVNDKKMGEAIAMCPIDSVKYFLSSGGVPENGSGANRLLHEYKARQSGMVVFVNN